MSETPIADALSERVYNLIHDVLAEHGGGMVDGFALGVCFADCDGEPRWVMTVAPGQRIVTTAGITDVLGKFSDMEVAGMLRDDDG